jgi:hypothetical protein
MVIAKTETLLRIAQVDPVHADTMSRQPTTFSTQPLSFYGHFKLLTADVMLPHRPIQFRYMDDGRQVVVLTGREQDIYNVNAREKLSLDASQVPEYVRIFIANTGGTGRRVVESAADVPWRGDVDTTPALATKKAEASSRLQPLRVTPAAEGFQVVALVLEDDTLHELTLAVRKDGHVDTTRSQVELSSLPVPVTF